MSGNATYRLSNTAVLSICAVEAPIVATSADFDARLESILHVSAEADRAIEDAVEPPKRSSGRRTRATAPADA